MASGAGAAELTIAEKLQDIMNSKEQIRQAIESQGVSVPSNTPLSQYASKIGSITCDAGGPSSSSDFCAGTINSSTPLSINSIFSSNICSPLGATSKFPFSTCGNYTYDEDSYTWEGTSCPLISGTAKIYGNARCSTQRDTAGHGYSEQTENKDYCLRPVSTVPSNDPGTGTHCWCQMCTDSTRTSCGAWVYIFTASAFTCRIDCADDCGSNAKGHAGYISQAVRAALCAAAQ